MKNSEAKFISFITSMVGRMLTYAEIDYLTVELNAFQKVAAGEFRAGEIDDLFRAMIDGRKIDAIKCHRAITGMGLKDSKEAIEKWIRDTNLERWHHWQQEEQKRVSEIQT